MEKDSDLELLNYTYFCEADNLRSILNDKEKIKEIDNDIIDLAKDISICSVIAWNQDGWREETMPLVLIYRERANKALEVWKNYFGVERLKKPDYFNKYSEKIYCDDEFGGMFYEEDKEINLRHGVRDIDLYLYFYTCCFDIEKVKELIYKGANIDANIVIDDIAPIEYNSPRQRVIDETSYLATYLISFVFEDYLKDGRHLDKCIKDYFAYYLIGWGAHEDMFNLLTSGEYDYYI